MAYRVTLNNKVVTWDDLQVKAKLVNLGKPAAGVTWIKSNLEVTHPSGLKRLAFAVLGKIGWVRRHIFKIDPPQANRALGELKSEIEKSKNQSMVDLFNAAVARAKTFDPKISIPAISTTSGSSKPDSTKLDSNPSSENFPVYAISAAVPPATRQIVLNVVPLVPATHIMEKGTSYEVLFKGAYTIGVNVVQDITALAHVDAVVNAANSGLTAGAGVCGAFDKNGGQRIFDECNAYLVKNKVTSVPTGSAMITNAGNLKAKFAIHAVAPMWSGRDVKSQSEQLYNAYYSSLEVASGNGLTSIAFPSLGTGIFNFPLGKATPIAAKAIHDFFENNPATSLEKVEFAVWQENFQSYKNALEATVMAP
ncbi:MAG: hypothetical protein CK425_04280 [Parachlamydia sp.]|nr:MAG: hypothetical protein CK425_04280 [Parachlamydia sp.]